MQANGDIKGHNGKGQRKLNLRRKVEPKVFVPLEGIIRGIGKS